MYYFIVNPASKSGHGIKVWHQVEAYLKENSIEYEVFFSKRCGHVQQLVGSICSEHLEESERINLVIMGGDGTFNEAVQGVISFDKINIGYIPTGSGNDFARAMNYSDDPVENAKRVLGCKEPLKHDIGKLKFVNISDERTAVGKGAMAATRYFNVSCGIGFDAAVTAIVNESSLKKRLNKIGLGKLAYGLVAVKELCGAKLCDARLMLDDSETIDIKNCRFIVGMNTCYEGGGYKFAPHAVPDDGYLDICLVEDISNLGALIAIPSATKGTHTKFKKIHTYHVREFEVIAKEPLWVHTDGEVHAKSDHIKVSLVRGGMNFLY